MFDVSEALDGLRCRESVWLHDRRAWLVAEQRRLHLEELAVTRVLDERGLIDESLAAADGVSVRDVRATVATARAIESLPHVAAAAAEGLLSDGQLAAVAKLADESTDREWAERAQQCAPADLEKLARAQQTPSVDDARRRFEARSLKFWWGKRSGMLEGHFALPDLQGAAFESVIQQMTERMKPAKGQPWERWDRRAADALSALVDRANGETGTVADGIRPKVTVHLPTAGPAEIADGVLLATEQVEALRANATVEAAIVDERGDITHVSPAVSPVSAKRRLAVIRRDGKCRWPGCETRWGLEVHHLRPRSHGGSDDTANLAAVCALHHRRLIPQGTFTLEGVPSRPDGLTLRRVRPPPLSG